MARQNDLCDGVADLAGKAFTPVLVRDNPKIFTGRSVRGREAKFKGKGSGAPPPDERGGGGLFIRDLWTQGVYIIQDMHVVNNDAVSYQFKTPEKCMETTESKKKKNYPPHLS